MSGETDTLHLPSFERLRYFHGQMLGSRDFRDEQAYHREKTKLLTRCLDGYGIVCGFDVTPVRPPDDCKPADRRRRQLVVEPGVAVDCAGNVLVLGSPCTIDMERLLDVEDARIVERHAERGESCSLYLSVCYLERGASPTRPMASHSCATGPTCEYGRTVETVSFRLGLDAPAPDERCDTCCVGCGCGGDGSCGDCCLLLARIDLAWSADPPDHGDPPDLGPYGYDDPPADPGRRPYLSLLVRNEYRRMLARHELTTITGLSWWHGATYGVGEATELAKSGLVLELSGAVRADSLRPGIVDVIVHQGGKGNVGGLYYVTGAIEVPADQEWTDRIVWCADTDETFQNGDRVNITLRGDFVLDRCCRPIDADHVGGLVPPTADAPEPVAHTAIAGCPSPPDRFGPWRSGNGTPGGTFESWLYVTTDAGDKS